MNDQWFFTRGQDTFGPVSLHELHELAAAGQLLEASLIWREGMADWLPAAALGIAVRTVAVPPPVPEFAAPAGPPTSMPEPPPVTQSLAPPSPAPLVERSAPAAITVRSPRTQLSPVIVALGVVVLVLALAVGWMAHALSQSSKPTTTAANAANANVRAPDRSPPRSSSPSRSDEPRGSAGELDRRAPVRPPLGGAAPTEPGPAPSDEPIAAKSLRSPPAAAATTGDVPGPLPPSPASAVPAAAAGEGLPAARPEPPAPRASAPESTAPGTSSPARTAHSYDTPPAAVPKPAPAAQRPKTLFQEIEIARAPKFSILGSVMAQDLQYKILSQLYVDEPDAEGVRVVEQAVVDTRLVRADDLSQATFANSLRELKGWRCRYKVHHRGEVTDLEATNKGRAAAVAVAPKAASQGFLLTSVMDPDGWREIAELTFFVPPTQDSEGAAWTRKVTHDYGPLGSWYGMTRYQPHATRDGMQQIDFAHQLAYQPPMKDVGALPFAIKGSTLKPEVAGGVIQYDPTKRRVVQAQERFLVRGVIHAELAGQAIPVELEESQVIQVRVHERNPW